MSVALFAKDMEPTVIDITGSNRMEVDDDEQVRNVVDCAGGTAVEWIKDMRKHVLLRPDMYLGPIAVAHLNGSTMRMVGEKIKKVKVEMVRYAGQVSPGWIKIVDEAIVNALDNAFNDAKQANIHVAINPTTGEIMVMNDGCGISAELYLDGTDAPPKHLLSVIFGEFMAGSNLSEDVKKFTGGRNGLGITCTNTFCERFEVTSACPQTESLASQRWESNMEVVHPVSVRKLKTKTGYVKLVFRPDYAKLNMQPPTADNPLPQVAVDVFVHRVMEAATCTCMRKCNVHLSVCNQPFGKHTALPKLTVPLTNPEKLLRFVVGADSQRVVATDKVVVATANGAVCVMQLAVMLVSVEEVAELDAHNSRQLGYVNGVQCPEGTHMAHVRSQIVSTVRGKVLAKLKKGEVITIRPQQVMSRLAMVVCALVADKQFTSQTKRCLSTPQKDLGIQWVPSKRFIGALCDRTSLVKDVLGVVTAKQIAHNTKGVGGKSHSAKRVEKYDAATKTGGKIKPTLLIVEGDSAKSFATAGLAAIGRTRHGVMPLRGKLVNVRKQELKASTNKEIQGLCTILGLRKDEEYDATKVARLPYGSITILCDSDADGVHIMGLVLNWMQCHYPSLLRTQPDFCRRLITPLVKVVLPDKTEQCFYTSKAYEQWESEQEPQLVERSEIRYYKGLGTSTSAEARAIFRQESDYLMTLRYTGKACDDALMMYFDADRIQDRKQLISADNYNANAQLDFAAKVVSIDDVVRRDLVHFAKYDTLRSLASMVDGLKIVNRKIMHHVLRKLKCRTKVAQLGAQAACDTLYAHGEQSMINAVVHMAQDFVGKSNIALVVPEGQFGTRYAGNDFAAPRYLHTKLDPITKLIFRTEDTPLLLPQTEEGQSVEPRFFMPIVPWVLVNGISGIGTGYSTFIPPHHPLEVIDRSRRFAKGEHELPPLQPWYDGFDGKLEPTNKGFVTTGLYTLPEWDPQDLSVASTKMLITELPIQQWVDPYLDFVKQSLMVEDAKEKTAPLVTDVYNGSSEHKVHIELRVDAAQLRALSPSELVKRFRLATSFTGSNMYAFDDDQCLIKFETATDIVAAHGRLRLDFYHQRLGLLITLKQKDIVVAEQTLRFVRMVVEDEIVVYKRKVAEIVQALEDQQFPPQLNQAATDRDYHYLLKLNILSFSGDKITELTAKLAKLQAELDRLKATTARTLWLQELQELELGYAEYVRRKQLSHGSDSTAVTKSTKSKPTRKRKVDSKTDSTKKKSMTGSQSFM